MDFCFREEPSLERAVTFILNKNKPIYNWFYFKEGYSKEFVDYCFEKYSLNGTIADPFCGSGTTLVAAKEKGFKAVGIDISPLACFISKVKTRNYDAAKIKEEFSRLKALKPEYSGEMPKSWVRDYFYGKSLANILFYKEEIEKIEDEKIKDFFILALMDSADKAANAIKQGASLRKVKKPPIPVKHLFVNKAKRMLRDVLQNPSISQQGDEAEILNCDSRNVEWEENSIDAVITSPPYMNKIEYTNIYKIELALFFGQQEKGLRAFISDEVKEEGASSIDIENAYFKDMKKVLENLYIGMKDGAKAIIELAGGCFPDRNVEADEKIAKIGEEIGLKCKEIVIARTIQCHRERTFKTGTVRESLVVLEK